MSEFKKPLDDLEHLPFFLKDFHDAKDFFKAFHEWASETDTPWKDLPSWCDCHILTLDYLLRFLAVHGYTLQKWRKKRLVFYKITETISLYRGRIANQFRTCLENRRPTP